MTILLKKLMNLIIIYLLNNDSSGISQTIKEMEIKDSRLSQKRQQFDNDYERLQKERGDIGNGMARK